MNLSGALPVMACMCMAGARVAFGGKPLEGHSIPDVYGAIQPTAVFVPLDQILKDENFGLVTTEVFGPFQARHNPGEIGQLRIPLLC